MSANSTQAYVEGPRFFTITRDDQRGAVAVVTVVFIIYAYMILTIRLAVRRRMIDLDDFLAVFATIIVTIQLGIIIGAVCHHFGTSFALYTEHATVLVAKLVRASDILYLLSLVLVKLCVILLCRRLFSVNDNKLRYLCDITTATSALWCSAAILTITVDCDERASIGLPDGRCSGLLNRWTIVGVLDAASEICIFCLSALVIVPLHMNFSRRVSAISIFAFRLLIVVLVALHIHYIREFTYSADKGVAIATPIMFRQAESLFSLLSASGPPLNQYLRRFQTTDVATFGFAPKDPSNQTSTASELRSHVRNSNLPAVVSPGQRNYEVAVESDNNYGMRNPDPRDSQYDGRSGSHNMTIKQGMVSRIDESYVKQDFDDMILDTSILNR